MAFRDGADELITMRTAYRDMMDHPLTEEWNKRHARSCEQVIPYIFLEEIEINVSCWINSSRSNPC